MASTILIPVGAQGLTLTADLYPAGSDTAVESAMAVTEKANAKGWYACTNTGTETGLYRLVLKSSGSAVGSYWIHLTNTSPTEDIAGDLPGVRASGVALADVDGLAFADYMESILAVLFGVAAPSGSTVAFKKRDGTTTKVTVTYGAADGERTGSVIA